MRAIEAVDRMLEVSGKTKAEVSREIGKYPSWLSSTIYKKSTPISSTLAGLANVMGYELVLEGHDERLVIDPESREDGNREETD